MVFRIDCAQASGAVYQAFCTDPETPDWTPASASIGALPLVLETLAQAGAGPASSLVLMALVAVAASNPDVARWTTHHFYAPVQVINKPHAPAVEKRRAEMAAAGLFTMSGLKELLEKLRKSGDKDTITMPDVDKAKEGANREREKLEKIAKEKGATFHDSTKKTPTK